MDPLDLPAQRAASARRLLAHPTARQALRAARTALLDDPVAQRPDGLAGLDRALNRWALALALRVVNDDPFRPCIMAIGGRPVRAPLGQAGPDASVAVDNPDDLDREVPVHAASRYVVRGRPGAWPGGFAVELVADLDGTGAGHSLCALDGRQLATDPDGGFVLTVDADAAGGRPNHLRAVPGSLRLLFRDTLPDWRQAPATLSIERIAGPDAPPPPGEAAWLAGLAQALPGVVRAAGAARDALPEALEPNRLAGPIGTPGGGRFLAAGRFALGPDEALLVTAVDGTAPYIGFQVADPWGVAPDPASRQCSLAVAQARADDDGTYAYVLSSVDPGAHNWIDLGGATEGWMLLRWHGLPPAAHPRALLKTVRRLRLEALAAALPRGTPMIGPAGRAEQLAARRQGRTTEG